MITSKSRLNVCVKVILRWVTISTKLGDRFSSRVNGLYT